MQVYISDEAALVEPPRVISSDDGHADLKMAEQITIPILQRLKHRGCKDALVNSMTFAHDKDEKPTVKSGPRMELSSVLVPMNCNKKIPLLDYLGIIEQTPAYVPQQWQDCVRKALAPKMAQDLWHLTDRLKRVTPSGYVPSMHISTVCGCA